MAVDNGKIRIAIADPQFLTSIALEVILREVYNISVICTSFTELIRWLDTGNVDLIIIDHSIPDLKSISQLAELSKKAPHLIILTNEISKSELTDLTSAGIEDVVLKTSDRNELLNAVELSLKGRKYYSEEILQLILENSSIKSSSTDICQLTSAEMEIVKLIAEGLTTKQIAAKKFISFHTVISHRKNIFRKAGVNSVSELIMYAIRAGWIDNIEYYI
jgi:DNA-binding NarL/FixJ family response regulator